MSVPATVPVLRPRAPVDPGVTVLRWRAELKFARAALEAAFLAHPDTPALLRAHARLVDRVLAGVWEEQGGPADIALVAVGGYGRGQLFPHSDVDVLILLPRALDERNAPIVERFIGLLWDIGIEIGHSVRTLADCEAEMFADVTVMARLLAHRLITGSRALFVHLRP